ncbi:MAG: resolvase [Lachnospiraceae bacterium]|nr:resolvase [Lachnospiraceae bacterium]
MCKALMEIMKEDIDKIAEQREKRGEKRGEKKGILNTLKNLVTDGILSITDAASRAGMTVGEFKIQAGIK